MVPTPANIKKMKALEKKKLTNFAKIKNSLIEALVKKNNSHALKILLYIAKDIQQFKAGFEIVKITLDAKELCKYTGLSSKSLTSNLLKMMETTISFFENEHEEHFTLLPRVHIAYGGVIEVDMYAKIFNLISEVTNKYTSINLTNLMKLKSKHSIRMMMLLEYINGFSKDIGKNKRYLLEELNGMFGTNYKHTKDFVRFILVPVKKELDTFSKLSFIHTLYLDKDDVTRGGRPSAKGINLFLSEFQESDCRIRTPSHDEALS